jgi:hypothetical protein
VPVTVGQYNTKFIQVCSGLKDGDRVLLAPPFDANEKDLGGAIIADETLPLGATNQFPRAKAPGKAMQARSREKSGPLSEVAKGGQPSGDMRSPAGTRPRGSTTSTNRADLWKRFDADGDGKLSAAEDEAMRQWLARRRGTNAPSSGPVVN